ncbi:hypothetical protein CHU94_08955 [Rhodoferax sp. TH121]|uniref:hypothetical protein n=1 Tax=Rhodoferax sp. TH121 TaxID=2022803 RepID=UPI000B95E2A9|nr:hypothetical protein [Rhodoferax sp. TH121]OYQ41217.1 hypothetical protein CHU94_08955 [Rhodoferax sp. TH121]
MGTLTMRLHPGSTNPENWRMKGRSRAYLAKGSISGSVSGYLCACMALIVLGVTSRSHIRSAYAVPEGRLQDFFLAGLESSFGLDDKGMAELLTTVRRFVRALRFRGKRDWLLQGAISRLSEGEVSLLCIGDNSFRYSEWKLAIGVEWRTDTTGTKPTALLVLDPTAPIGRMVAWNGRLELTGKPDSKYLYYTTWDGDIQTVTLKCVFALRKKKSWET